MTDLKALREMAEKALEPCSQMDADVQVVRLLDLAEAVLAFAEPENQKEPDQEALIACCKRVCVESDIPSLRAFLALNYPQYVGLAQADPPPPEQKQEKPRQWWLNEYANGIVDTLYASAREADNFAAIDRIDRIRVREVKEGE